MVKAFRDELSEWLEVRKEAAARQDKHAVAFLALRNDVKSALDAGYSMKTVWRFLKATNRLDCRYETFTHHVRRFLMLAPSIPSPPAVAARSAPKAPGVAEVKPVPQRSATAQQSGPSLGGFAFNPKPSKEELL